MIRSGHISTGKLREVAESRDMFLFSGSSGT